jgi:biopolymer transport protein TolR
MGEINVVPYIDVMLVLLDHLMINAPLPAQGTRWIRPRRREPLRGDELRDAAAHPQHHERGRHVPELRDDKDKPPDAPTVLARATAVQGARRTRRCWFAPTTSVQYGAVVTGMVLLQQAGAKKVGFVTEPPPVSRPRR